MAMLCLPNVRYRVSSSVVVFCCSCLPFCCSCRPSACLGWTGLDKIACASVIFDHNYVTGHCACQTLWPKDTLLPHFAQAHFSMPNNMSEQEAESEAPSEPGQKSQCPSQMPMSESMPESEPLLSAPIIHHCHIGLVIIQHQQCPLLHSHLFQEYPLLHKTPGKRSHGPSDDGPAKRPLRRWKRLECRGHCCRVASSASATAASDALATASGAIWPLLLGPLPWMHWPLRRARWHQSESWVWILGVHLGCHPSWLSKSECPCATSHMTFDMSILKSKWYQHVAHDPSVCLSVCLSDWTGHMQAHIGSVCLLVGPDRAPAST